MNFGATATQNSLSNCFMSAKNSRIKLDSVKDSRASLAMSTAIKAMHKINSNEIVSTVRTNHSSAKAPLTAFAAVHTTNSVGRPKSELKRPSQMILQQQFRSPVDSNRKQFISFNGIVEHATENSESLHKSINQSTIANLPASKTNEAVKSKKQTLSEKRLKQKIDAKSTHEKKKNVNGGKSASAGGRKYQTNQIHHEALQRLLVPIDNEGFTNADRTPNKRMGKEWHSPESYIYDDVSSDTLRDGGQFASCMQTFWFRDIPNENLLTREQRLETKRDNLRRQAFQYAQAQHFRSTILAKRRLITVTKALAKFKNERNMALPSKCSIQSCSNAALAMTAYCYLHITLNKDQKLFHPCTAKFSDNSQCRVPVFDISHELPLCREHAWKRDNYNRILQEQKPKKNLKTKTKPNETIRPPKRNKKRKRRNQLVVVESQTISKQPLKTIGGGIKQSVQPKVNVIWDQELFGKSEHTQSITTKSPSLITSVNKYRPENVMVYQVNSSVPSSRIKIQNIVSVGENSSAYESSEDTGVGELSETELMSAQDGIEIPLGDARLLEEHDLTNVLNQLPVDAFNDIFQVQQHDHYEPTQKEQDELTRALKEVDEQVKSLEQMTSSGHFLDNFLDVGDEILVDGTDICDELTTSTVKNDIRGLEAYMKQMTGFFDVLY